MRPSARPSRLLCLLAGIAFISAACVQPDAPDVGVSKIEAKLVFGAKPEEEPRKSIGQQVDNITEDLELAPEIDVSQFKAPPPSARDLNKEPRESACPAAPSGAAARDAATVNVEGPARNGVARWKLAGFFTLNDEKVPVADFQTRMVRNAKKVSDGVYTYETVEPTFNASQFLVSYFRVNTEKVNRDPSAGAGVIDSPVNVGEPDRGLVLVKREVRDRMNKLVGTPFQPTTPILLLPLPVTSQETWESAGVDPRSGETLVHNGTVRTVRTLDACGDLMIGWFVESTQRYSVASPAAQAFGSGEFRYDYMVATQYGGQIIQERFLPVNGDDFDITFSQAQLDPDPLPEG